MSFSSLMLLNPEQQLLVFGSEGQVGLALKDCLKDLEMPVVFLNRTHCDLADEVALRATLNRYQPQIIINAAAYTAVDRAESDINLAYAVNAKAPSVMAEYLSKVPQGTLVHFSTDYVYSGNSDRPYLESDVTAPLSQYGKSKLAGELGIQEAFESMPLLAEPPSRYFILRTSWVYGDGSNFIRTILRLAQEREELKVVADQYGAPSSAVWLARIALALVTSRLTGGVYHAVPDGVTSWHGLALFTIKTAMQYGEAIKTKLECVFPIATEEYPLPAMRPKNSRLNNHKLKQALCQMAYAHTYSDWREELEVYIRQYVQKSSSS
jgi:dTDP-4-dehydrorhamnose reductase